MFLNLFHKTGTAIGMHGRAFGFIMKNGMGWIFLIPILFTMALFYGGFSLINFSSDIADEFIHKQMTFTGWLSFLNWFIETFLLIFIQLALWLIYSFVGGYIVLILMSPFLAYVSEKTEKIQTGKNYPFELIHFIKDVFRGILIAIRNALCEFGIIILIFILSFIPIIGQIAGSILGSIFLFIVSAYFYGFSFMDYALERKGLQLHESVQFVRKRKGIAIGNGFLSALALMIPFAGTFIACFIAVLSTVSATLMILEEEE